MLAAWIFPALVWFVLAVTMGAAELTYIRDFWQASVAMLFGSLVAGTTSLGGGAAIYPILTKGFDLSPHDAKVFCLAIQSLGMTSASLLIYFMRYKMETKVIPWISMGGVLGMILSAGWLSKVVPGDALRVGFTMMVTALGVVLYIINRNHRTFNDSIKIFGSKEKTTFFILGICGGILSGFVGSGIGILTFSILALHFKLCEKTCARTAVVCMAINSLVGFAFTGLVMDEFQGVVKDFWFAAVPIVVLGGPLGAILNNMIKRKTIVHGILVLLSLEFLTTLIYIPLSAPVLLSAAITSTIFILFFRWIYFTHPDYGLRE